MWILLSLLIIVTSATCIYVRRRYSYWEKLGIVSLNPKFPFGDLQAVSQNDPPSVQIEKMYWELKRKNVRHGGVFLFTTPQYFPLDPEIVKCIMIKDFHHFMDRGVYSNTKDQPIMANLFFLEGEKWRNLRTKLTPTFTPVKMRQMFSTMLECSYPLKNRIDELVERRESIDAKAILSLFTTDVIGSCAFGIDCNNFKNPDSEFRKYGKKIFEDTALRAIKGIFQHVFPELSQKLGLILMTKDVEVFFNKTVRDTYKYRKENNIQRNDFMQLLIELKEEGALDMDALVAQAFIFFIAGYDSTATLLTFCLFELAVDKVLQDKVRNEINDVSKRYSGEISYDCVKDIKYLDQVLQETARRYPPVGTFHRVCTQRYKIPGTDVTLEKGTQVLISAMGLHRDPDYFPNPEKFDPERFSEKNKGNIRSGTYIPFGEGPRTCIGMRFGLMEAKICLITLLKNFEFSVNEKTKVPLEIGLGFITTVKGGVWLDATKI